MKTLQKTLIGALILTTLGGGMAYAVNPASSGLSEEVRSGSLRVPEGTESEAELAQLARITKDQAEAAALAMFPGEVIGASLDDENGFLVWKIAIKQTQGVIEVAVDAGDGQVLAADPEDEDEGHQEEREEREERRD